MPQAAKLSVNVNKIATLRNARGGNVPCLRAMSRLILKSGADGLTAHPRPDERHIRKSDVPDLKKIVQSYKGRELNIEGFPSKNFLDLVAEVRPDQCSLVPDPPYVLTSNAGWRLHKNLRLLEGALKRLRERNIRASLFLEPLSMSRGEWEALSALRPDRIELYTEALTLSLAGSLSRRRPAAGGQKKQAAEPERVILAYKGAAEKALEMGIEVNAGHDLNQKNLPRILHEIPEIKEVSIGQALIAEALEHGLKHTVQSYLKIIRAAAKQQSAAN